MKKINLLISLAGILFVSNCDIIDKDERLIPITGGSFDAKNVLLLDFTDQNCQNCIHATVEIEKLIERFSDTIVAVSIHANPLPYPLVTSEGKVYEQHFQAEDHPAGVIDGGGSGKYMSHDPQVWGGFIFERLKTEAAIYINISTDFDVTTNVASIDVELEGKEALSGVNLQLWIIENNIKHWQLMLDGTRNNDYIHNHVFRASINGTWGESFIIGAEETKNFNYKYTLNMSWKPEDINIIGFIYHSDTDETMNVQEIPLIKKQNKS